MIINFFKRPLPLVLATIIGIGILLWLKPFLGLTVNTIALNTNQMPFFDLIFRHLGENRLLGKIISFAVMMITSFYLVQLSSKFILIRSRTYFPALIFILLTASFPVFQGLNPALFASLFLALALNHTFQIYETKKPHNSIFMAGFYCALASLFYISATTFMLVLFISLLITGTLNYRFWLIPVTGFITPWFFVFIYHYLWMSNPAAPVEIIKSALNSNTQPNHNAFTYIHIAIIGVIIVISLAYLLNMLQLQKINIRKFHGILIWFSLISVVSVFVLPTCSFENIYIIAIPVSFQISQFLASSRSRYWPSIILVTLFTLTAVQQIIS